MELKDDVALLAALRDAASRKVSQDELRKQRVSFIFSAVKDRTGITKSKISDILDGNFAQG